MAHRKHSRRFFDATHNLEGLTGGGREELPDNVIPLEPDEAKGLQELLRRALAQADLRLYRLATDAISRARSCHGLFELDDYARLRKAAEVGDAANRLYAAALLLAMAGHPWLPEAGPMAA